MLYELFKIGPITIHTYGVMIAVGILAGYLLADRRAKKRGINRDHLFNVCATAVVFGFVCAKLLYCIVEYKAFFTDPWRVLSGSGFVVYGGMVGGIVAAMVYCRIRKVAFLQYFDLAAPSIALAQGFGRLGCLFAGCCYGYEVHGAFGIVFPDSSVAPAGVKLFPTQIISSAGDFLFAILLLLYAKNYRRAGRTGALYLMLYSVGRFFIEFFRSDSRGSIGFLSTSQFIALLMLPIGLFLFFSKKMGNHPQELPEAELETKPEEITE